MEVLKYAAISWFLIRFSMSGLIQYLTLGEMAGPRCTRVTRAPWRHSSSAAMAAEFFAPTTTTSEFIERMRLAIIMRDLGQILTGNGQSVG